MPSCVVTVDGDRTNSTRVFLFSLRLPNIALEPAAPLLSRERRGSVRTLDGRAQPM